MKKLDFKKIQVSEIRRAIRDGKEVSATGRYGTGVDIPCRIRDAKLEGGKTWVQEHGGLQGWFVPERVTLGETK